MPEYITERTAGAIIKDSIKIYRHNFLVLLSIYALPVIPFVLLSISATESNDEPLIVVSTILETIVGFFTTGAVTVAVSDTCLGNAPSITRSYVALKRVLWRYLGTYLLVLLLIAIGLVVLIIPGIYAMVVLMFALPVCIIERRSALDACKRSRTLGKGHYLRNFGVLFLMVCLFMLALFAIALILVALMAGLSSDPSPFVFDLLGGLIGIALAPVLQIAVILLYYDMRVRKEHFDGAALAQELMT